MLVKLEDNKAWVIYSHQSDLFYHLKISNCKVILVITSAGVAQLVEHQLPKLRVAGSNPVSRSILFFLRDL
jgi:hypothetical protein